MKITMAAIPPSMNEFAGKCGWKYRDEKKKWTALVLAACLACGDTPVQPMAKAMVRIDYYFPDRRRRDPDNYGGKLLMDGLTRAGVIADDSFAHVSISLHAHVDRQNPRTEICVVPMWGKCT